MRDLGGVTVASEDGGASGAGAVSRLVFRIPADRADDAIAAFARLGTVTGGRAEKRGTAGGPRADLTPLVLTLTARSAP